MPIRGNVDTRIGKVRSGELDAVVVAAAGLRRLGRIDEAGELLDPLQMLPAPAQGALAVECRAADTALAALLAQVLDDAGARAAVTAERAVLATLEAGCSAPVGALADVVSDLDDDGRVVDRVFLRAVVGTGDGALLRASATGDLDDVEKLGAALAAELLDMGDAGRHRRALRRRSTGSRSMNRAPSTPGRVAFVGSGPGDPGLLTVRARDALGSAPLVVTDPDVPDGVLALVADGAEVRPAVGEPADVAADLVAEATAGRSVVRLVGGDPLTADAVVAETLAVAAAGLPFDIVPGVAPGTAVPTYAGVPLGSAHVEADVRAGVDWAALAAVPGPLVLHATAAHLSDLVAGLTAHGLAPTTPVAVTSRGTLTAQKTVQTTLATLAGEARTSTARWSSRSGTPSSSARGCRGGSPARCTGGACWCRAPRTRQA